MKYQRGHFSPYVPWWLIAIGMAIPVLAFAGIGLLVTAAIKAWKRRRG